MDDSNSRQKAKEYVSKAEDCLKKWKLFYSGDKYYDAASFYNKAALQFKLAKDYKESGNAFERAAALSLSSGSSFDAAKYYLSAGEEFHNYDFEKATMLYSKAIGIYKENDEYSMAGKIHNTLATLYESQNDFENAIKHFQSAADCYALLRQNVSGNAVLVKVAECHARIWNFDKAIEIYEKVAREANENKLLKYGAKDHYADAALCELAKRLNAPVLDNSAVLTRIESYAEESPVFKTSRNCAFLKEMAIAAEEGDAEKFLEKVYDADSCLQLEKWKVSLLLEVKEKLEREAQGVVEEDFT